MPLSSPLRENGARWMIAACGGYLEDLISRGIAPQIFLQLIKQFDRAPLGAMVDKIRKFISPTLYQDLKWFSGTVYNFAKHNFDEANRSNPEEDHYFTLAEAIAVYFIVRKLGEELIRECDINRDKVTNFV